MKLIAAALFAGLVIGLGLIAGALVYDSWEDAESERCDRVVAAAIAAVERNETLSSGSKAKAEECV